MKPDLDEWLTYFRRSCSDGIDWTLPATLTPDEFHAVARSIAVFQLGEQSEGNGLMNHARAHAAMHGDFRLVAITRIFINEEQHHAALLKRFMREADIPLKTRDWTDTIFRQLRRHVGYELAITVLITAELIAISYYEALLKATDNQLLRQICRKIIQDEQAHVRYESSLIMDIRRTHSTGRGWLTRAGHWCLFHGALVVVLLGHYPVLSAAGYTGLAFARECRRSFDRHFGKPASHRMACR